MHVRRTFLGAATALGLVAAAAADDLGPGVRTPMPAKYRQECAACHIAYSPALLPVASWQRLLSDLPHHFGTDASLDPATVKELDAWFVANAAGQKGIQRGPVSSPPEDRITRSRWFVREHDDVAPATWKLPAVKSPSNCAACHRQAEQGVFDEHDVRIPR